MNHKKSDPPYTPAFVTVKLIDIGITYTYFFVVGLIMGKVFDYIYSDLLDESETDWKTYPIGLFTLNILFHFFLVGVSVYLIRNIVSAIPYPLDGMAGYQHHRLKELGGGAVLIFMIFLFQKNLTEKVKIYAERVIGVTETAESSEIEASVE
jgi:uncharacterized membrane protein